jgi:hypothetical protein
MQSETDFQIIFTQLKQILQLYARGKLHARAEKRDQYELVGPPTPRSRGKELWFGAVRIGKRYVSYHLMALYVCPDLLNKISPALKKRMQGKSCFNFSHVDEKLFQELSELTELGYERFKQEGFINS